MNYLPFILLIAHLKLGLSQYQLNCYTPNAEPGTCIKIKECPSILNILKRKNPQDIEFVKKSKCGRDNGTPNVCCPEASNPNLIVNRISVSQVEQHRNYGKINALDCGVITDEKIVGGNKTRIGEFPWMALISYRTGRELDFRCAGALISDWYVLTAAHCIHGLESGTSLAGVRLGEHDISTVKDCYTVRTMQGEDQVCAPKVQDVAIAKVIVHPDYVRQNYWSSDIGLIKLKKPANLTRSNIGRICLPIMEPSDRTGVVTGWGRTEAGYSSNELLKANLEILDNKNCLKEYAKVTPQHICSLGPPRVDSCDGDSGGPLQIVQAVNNNPSYVAYGIVSVGTPYCGIVRKPGIYTKVSSYMQWILDNID